MKYLIVNGDDFGASPGVNRGIREAHENGILTSASLLVNSGWAEQAARMAAAFPELSVGLHAEVDRELEASSSDAKVIRESLRRQFDRFERIVGQPPTHLDSHHNVHRDARALPHFMELAREHGLPLREHSIARYYSNFYGQWAGQAHMEQVSVEKLEEIVRSEIADGITELGCHPGYVDENLTSSYRQEREAELRTLCDPRIRRRLVEERVTLISYHEIANLR